MRVVTTQATVWASGDFTGPNRPMQRATIAVLNVIVQKLHYWKAAQYLFGQTDQPRELPNVRSIHYDRHTNTDAATMTMTLYNTEPLPLGTACVPDDYGNYTFDQPGFFTYSRGLTASNRWHYATNQWQGLLAPDRVIRTFEGYGYDSAAIPEHDTHMTGSGVWIIDEVDYTADGLITITCRDAARLLLDEIMCPPVIPMNRYPLRYTVKHAVANPPIVSTSSGWLVPTYETDSGVPYVGVDGNVEGHHPHDAFDANSNSYWLSIGNDHPRADYAFEYLQGGFSAHNVRHVQIYTWGGPYVAYISVYSGGAWKGAGTVPYNQNAAPAAPNGANIRYVKRVSLAANAVTIVDLGATYNATKIRVCLTSLTNSRIGTYPYRGGIRTLRVGTSVSTSSPGGTHMEPSLVQGGYSDYTDIVKQLLAWAGFHWPSNAAYAKRKLSDGSTVTTTAPSDDAAIGYSGDGRVWADIERAGVAAIAGTTLDTNIWDKKPVMDGIAYIRDILGFIFFIDETGAAVFRAPNIFAVGNFAGDVASGSAYVAGIGNLVVIDENQTLVSLSVKLSSRNQRERVFVANANGKIGATAKGRYGKSGPFNSNLRRVGGWTDQHFATSTECLIMAELIVLRQLFTYRTDRLRIPGYSAIQIDDQVKILEGTTGEDFIHYVAGLSSDWNIETGEWWYDLDTHWLGESPYDRWAFKALSLSSATQNYLTTLGRL